jgi:hypothetical protein
MIRFKNDSGNGFLTEILNAETGEDVTKILAIENGVQLTIDQGPVRAQCRIFMAAIDLTAAKTIFEALNPVTKKYEPVRAIEFCDGSRVEIAEDGTPSVVPPASDEAVA